MDLSADPLGPLSGRTAIVTGAGQGVGEGIARHLAGRGANVVIAARRAATGEPVAASLRAAGARAVCVETDVTDAVAVQRCVDSARDTFGGLEIVVHNAFGGARPHHLADVDLNRDWSLMSRTGVWAVLHCARAAWPSLLAAGERGRFVLVTSPSAMEGSANIPLYSPVKAAERAIAKSLAREWGPYGVTVNCIAPVAETPALSGAFDADPALRDAISARTSLGRVGDPTTDIGAVVSFLASDDARYVTGQTIVCDGGSYLGL